MNESSTKGWVLMSVDNRDKPALPDKAKRLLALGYSIASTGGTAKCLKVAEVEVTDLSDIIDFPELFNDLVKTLHHKVHAGILAPQTLEASEKLKELGIDRIVGGYVTIYDGAGAIADPNSTRRQIAEKQDMGGPGMIGSFAKAAELNACDGHYGTFVATSPEMCDKILDRLESGTPFDDEIVHEMVAEGFMTVARHRGVAAVHYGDGRYFANFGELHRTLRRAENPQQGKARQYRAQTSDPLATHAFQLLNGDPGSVNTTDLDRGADFVVRVGANFEKNALAKPFVAAAMKHGQPCGVGISFESTQDAIRKMIASNTQAIFGATVTTSFRLGAPDAHDLVYYMMEPAEEGEPSNRRLIHQVVAPSFSDEAIASLKVKKDIVLYGNPALENAGLGMMKQEPDRRPLRGGEIVQQPLPPFDLFSHLVEWPLGDPSQDEVYDVVLGATICECGVSNTVTLVRGGMLLGNGAGQTDRVTAAKLAMMIARDAGHDLRGAVAVSDSFFPFPDGPTLLCADAKVNVIFATSGSKAKGGGDPETLRVCQEHGVKLGWGPDEYYRMFRFH
ncbi:MAG: hypothetical protein HZB70_02475 [Candidatus Berkelbacteria bacterium]|nr:MAG: hypothetical protein HZB70_02475 [Candidatus Berkelbacteria bacterium]QQG51826.1 MAG: hypothetical protein HY845_00520 [Candidatus Berkelbacteria bacterium]